MEDGRGEGGLWQSTQGLEAKRLIPQEALHPVLIRREFYERFGRYPLCVLGSRREYARRIGLRGNIGRRERDAVQFLGIVACSAVAVVLDIVVDSACLLR